MVVAVAVKAALAVAVIWLAAAAALRPAWLATTAVRKATSPARAPTRSSSTTVAVVRITSEEAGAATCQVAVVVEGVAV